ncbi:hypothetical protein N7540_005549 [Penicillium herquei]|nr:hypothetical protein N7540_005549 [Penicillium herquei]
MQREFTSNRGNSAQSFDELCDLLQKVLRPSDPDNDTDPDYDEPDDNDLRIEAVDLDVVSGRCFGEEEKKVQVGDIYGRHLVPSVLIDVSPVEEDFTSPGDEHSQRLFVLLFLLFHVSYIGDRFEVF